MSSNSASGLLQKKTLWWLKRKPRAGAKRLKVSAESERSSNVTWLAAPLAALPSRPWPTAATSALSTTASAGSRSPLASTTPARGRARAHLDDALGKEEADALLGRERGHRFGEPLHAARDAPDPLELDVGDQHQRRGREEGGRAAVGGVAAEELAQARVGEVAAELAPEGLEGLGAQQAAHAGGAHRQRERRGARGADEAVLERLEHLGGALAEGAKSRGRGGSRELADGLGAAIRIGEEIEALAGAPGVAREQLRPGHRHPLVEARAGPREQLVEHPLHGEDGGAGVDPRAGHLELPDLPPGAAAASTTVTARPSLASSSAAASPPTPDPTTTTCSSRTQRLFHRTRERVAAIASGVYRHGHLDCHFRLTYQSVQRGCPPPGEPWKGHE